MLLVVYTELWLWSKCCSRERLIGSRNVVPSSVVQFWRACVNCSSSSPLTSTRIFSWRAAAHWILTIVVWESPADQPAWHQKPHHIQNTSAAHHHPKASVKCSHMIGWLHLCVNAKISNVSLIKCISEYGDELLLGRVNSRMWWFSWKLTVPWTTLQTVHHSSSRAVCLTQVLASLPPFS